MAPKERNQKNPRRRRRTRGDNQLQTIKGKHDRNQSRKNQYATDPDYADKQKKAARDNYKANNPREISGLVRSRGQLLGEGSDKEVDHPDLDAFEVLYCYSIEETAVALDKTALTIRRWVKDQLIPPPIFKEVQYNGAQYSKGELQSIAGVLADHEREYKYFTNKHDVTINRIWQAVHAYRQHNI